MKIYFRPNKSPHNKYISNTIKSLNKKGIYIVNKKFNNNFLNEIIIGIYFALLNKTKIFHFNWILNSVDDKNKPKSIIKTFIYIVWFLFLKSLGCKIIWVFHNKIPHECHNLSLVKFFRKFMIKHSNRIIIHNKEESKKILSKYLDKTEISRKVKYIPHGNYIQNYRDSQRDLKKEIGIKKGEFVFLFLGKIRKYKNVNLLIDSFKEANFENASLLIAGKPRRKTLGKKIQIKVNHEKKIFYFPQFIKDEEIIKYLNTADFVVLPYDKSSTLNSGAIFLALSYRTPVVTSDIGTAKDLKDKSYIYSYNYQNKEEHRNQLRSTMEKVYKQFSRNKESYINISKEAKRDVKNNNSWDIVGKELKEVYKSCYKILSVDNRY